MSRQCISLFFVFLPACLLIWTGQVTADGIDGIKISLDISNINGQVTSLSYSYGYKDANGSHMVASFDPTPWHGFKVTITDDSSWYEGPNEEINVVELSASQPKKTWWVKVAGKLNGSVSFPFEITSNGYPLQILGWLGETAVAGAVAGIECANGKCSYACESGTCERDFPKTPFSYTMSLTPSDETSFVVEMTANGPLYYPAPAPSALILFGSGSAFLLCPFLRDLMMRFQRRRG